MMQPRASILGGSWWNDDNAGSRYANVDNWADNSNENIGARGRSDDRNIFGGTSRTSHPSGASLDDAPLRVTVRHGSRSCRPSTPHRLRGAGWWSARLSCFGEHTTRSGRAGRRRLSLYEGRSRPAAGLSSPSHRGERL